MSIYVLVHGGCHGGWCWQRLARLLRSAGHEVYTPTLTGLGERRHLLSPETNLDTHIDDVVNVLVFEDLKDVILVGHSYSGGVITGVADRALSRVGHLVFLDATHPRNGEAHIDANPIVTDADHKTWRIVDGVELVNGPSLEFIEGMGITDPRDVEWMMERITPQPLKCNKQPLKLADEAAVRKIPCTNINASWSFTVRSPESARRARAGDRVWEIDSGHDLMITEPEALAEMLLRLASPASTSADLDCSRKLPFQQYT
ncbi:alpha/beta hydrolase [Phyllobacterium phragmitis]|uniref:Alpha/beta hydrolase n=1 Tax=Phyllobacterium phragmitis TaxID=2670329 RepID=A0A2S9IJJ8_9HYPH|nr:alpha/beta hydrolase [Phyllobacterium phragmitis]PRD40689.1 alpha/beta hydrolase [Phyllobacterium phragmitis]